MSERAPPQDLPRQFGSYTLLKMLARGGMGEIYLARTVGLTGFEKYYAVKKLLRKFTTDNDVGARFIDEAKLGARLQHPNIVQVYDLGKVTDELFMATEFVDGFDLRRVLRFCHEKKKRIPLDIALFIVREVLSGLAYAHRQVDADGALINLIHRDISPQNVLVSFEGEVKIIDFGLAKSTQRSQETQANVLLGNFGYMSPEQARGQILDVRTDVYSCGIVLFELVTGTKRFVEENPLKLLEMVARPTAITPSDRVPSIPKAIDRIYEKATSQDRDARFASAEAFRDDVTAALHKLNPKASRENLAQFLSHLFLGGQAPPTVDNDVLNKSVVLMAKDLNAGAEAFNASPTDDLKNRALSSDFADTAPQTASHPLLRSARVGDELTHEAITGEPEMLQVVDDFEDLDAGVQLVEGFDQVAMTGGGADDDPVTSDGSLIGEDESQRATRVYDSPSWPQTDSQQEPIEPTEVRHRGPSSSELEVQRQLDEQAEAQAAVQRQLELQAREAELQAQMQAQLQVQVQMQMEQARLAEAQRQVDAQREALAHSQRQAQLEEQQRQVALQRQAEQQARQQALQAQMVEAQQEAMRQQEAARQQEAMRQQEAARQQEAMRQQEAARQQEAMRQQELLRQDAIRQQEAARARRIPDVMATVEVPPPAAHRRPPTMETPSIMLSPELEILTDEATIRNPRASAGGFGVGGGHESLIIDFGGNEGSGDEDVPVVEAQQEPAIRPAARPMGKGVAPPAPAPRPRRVSDEGPPSTMPPPTRRR